MLEACCKQPPGASGDPLKKTNLGSEESCWTPCLVAVGVLARQALAAILAERVLVEAREAHDCAIVDHIALITEVGALHAGAVGAPGPAFVALGALRLLITVLCIQRVVAAVCTLQAQRGWRGGPGEAGERSDVCRAGMAQRGRVCRLRQQSKP